MKENPDKMDPMVKTEPMAAMVTSLNPLSRTSLASSALQAHQETKEAPARRDHEDRKELQERTAKMETKEMPVSKDLLDFKDQLDLQAHQDHKELLDVSTKLTDLPDHQDRQAHQEPQERRVLLESMERTQEADKVPQETMALQDLKEHQAHKAHLDHKDQMASQVLANIVHHQELHQAIKLFLLLFCLGIDFFIHHHHQKINC